MLADNIFAMNSDENTIRLEGIAFQSTFREYVEYYSHI